MSGVYVRLGTNNIPSEITSGNIVDLANDRISEINTIGNLSVSGDNIPTNLVSPIKDLVTADVMARTLGIDIDTQIGVGNIRLEYRDISQAEQAQIQYFLNKAEKALDLAIGQRIVHGTTIKVA